MPSSFIHSTINGKGGYYCYQLDADPVVAGVKLGMTVEVASVTSPYSGMQETLGGTFRIVDETIKTVEPTDITAKFAAGESLKNYVGLVVTVKGVELGGQDLEGSHQYLYFKLNGKEAYVRSYTTDFPTTLVENGAISTTAKATMDADHAAHFGYQADVTGILVLYSGAPYLIPTSVTPFTNYVKVEKTPAQKVEAEKEELKVADRIEADTTLTLPLVGKYYDDVTIAWAIDNENYTIGEDGELAIALGDEQVTLTLTATITCGETTETVTFTVKVDAAATDLYIAKPVTTPVADTAYKFFLNQVTLGKTLYLTGEVDGRYLVTTDKPSKAVDVYVETAEGGVKFYILVDGAKQYITVYKNADDKDSVKFDAEGTSVFAYNATVNAWTTNLNGTDYYLGTYSNYNTVSASKLSYISAENTGVTQFPAGVGTFKIVTGEPVTPPAGGEGGEGGGSTTPTVITTIAEALTAADGTPILLTGTVKTAEAWNTQFGNMNFTLTDGTNDIYVFRVYTQVGVGDVVTVSGVMGTHYENRQVAQGATITIDTLHVCTEYTGGSCTIAATCPVCGAESDAELGHNFVEGTCTECGESEQAAATNVTASKTIAELITANGWTDSTTKQSFTLDDVVSVKVDGGANSGKAYGGDHIRIYATDSPAGTLTISLAEGYELVSVKISAKTGTYAFLQVDGGDGSDISNVETLVSGSSVKLNSVKNGTNGKQVQVTAIEVTYRPVSA